MLRVIAHNGGFFLLFFWLRASLLFSGETVSNNVVRTINVVLASKETVSNTVVRTINFIYDKIGTTVQYYE
jgi:hypothetical protein